MSRQLFFKVIIVGDGGIGKSTMVKRLTTGMFVPQKITIGTDLATINIDMADNRSAKLQIWDFAGEKRFRFFLPNYARGALGCVLCYDITRYHTIENLTEWYDIVKNNAADPVFVLVGTKLDLEKRRTVGVSIAKEFQKKYNLDYFFETSSKSGENNYLIFQTLTQGILKKHIN